MTLISKLKALEILSNNIGIELSSIAKINGVTIGNKECGYNKGWKGQALEKLLGLEINSSRSPNGLGFELKSVAFIKKDEEWKPKETMAITMINSDEVIKNTFLQSHCWNKLKSTIFCAVSWDGHFAATSKLIGVSSLDFVDDENLFKSLELDYIEVQRILKIKGLSGLSGKMGKLIQPRTKGKGHGSVGRAFYARKGFIDKVIEANPLSLE